MLHTLHRPDAARKDVPKGGIAKGFIHSHGAWQQDSDNDFSPSVGMTGDYDADLMAHNDDLDFYLAAPNGNLLVNRNSDYLDNRGTVLLAKGLPRDEKKYGLYPKGHKAKVEWDEYIGPHESLKDLDPVDDSDPIKLPNNRSSTLLNGPRYIGDYGGHLPPWLDRSKYSWH